MPRRFPIALVALLLAAAACQQLDHFKFYELDPAAMESTHDFQLHGQFDPRYDEDEWKQHRVGERARKFFGNPTAKTRGSLEEPRQDEAHHLTWYELDRTEEPLREVWLRDQFHEDGPQLRILTANPEGILVPTHKIEPDSEEPKGLDHYKVYRIVDWKSPWSDVEDVDLEDQFDQGFDAQRVTVGKPEFLAVPVRKWKGTQKPPPLADDVHHLVIYPIDPREDYDRWIEIENQFDEVDQPEGEKEEGVPVRVRLSRYLAVPATKITWQPAKVGK